ncbi:YbaB/EbfC family nucleoid-associated protein [Nocardia africana]|uniref:YbaB/EbfC family nucleoid-associated protein n=1 Tax=Nocardia africana TaxID=134964 RepID=A0ABW6NF67_9NOCA
MLLLLLRASTVEVAVVNERLHADMMTVLEGLDEQLRGIAEIQLRRSRLTATASACEQRIQVTVNADGLLIDTKFADDIADLTYDEIAAGMTAAVQQAAAEVLRLGAELMRPLRERKAQLPKLSEFVEGAPDLGQMMPTAPPAPTRVEDYRDVPPAHPVDGSAHRSMVSDED